MNNLLWVHRDIEAKGIMQQFRGLMYPERYKRSKKAVTKQTKGDWKHIQKKHGIRLKK
jgi:hypothetical protein